MGFGPCLPIVIAFLGQSDLPHPHGLVLVVCGRWLGQNLLIMKERGYLNLVSCFSSNFSQMERHSASISNLSALAKRNKVLLYLPKRCIFFQRVTDMAFFAEDVHLLARY